jgi:Kef-type K+ transport system membrane component KefB
MVPRGEVGLIFASIGKGLGVVDDSIFSAVVIMVIATTLVTPPLLKFSLARGERRSQRNVAEAS